MSSEEGLQRRTISSNASENESSSKDAKSPPSNRPPKIERKSIESLVMAVSIPLILGVVDAIFNNPNQEFYRGLKKPVWNPPGWLFGVAWGLLYPAMGIASWLVWVKGGLEKQKKPLGLYIAQLFVNLLWPYFFFGLHNIKLALFDIIALDFLIILCIKSFNQIDHLASTLFKPYLAWVAFATLLNYALLTMN